jgi:hypothetical protein
VEASWAKLGCSNQVGRALWWAMGGGQRRTWAGYRPKGRDGLGGCCDWADAEENKGNGLGREKGFSAEIVKRIGWLQKCPFELIQGFDFKIKRFEYFQTEFELDSK